MGAPIQRWGDMANRLGPASQALAARRFFSSSAEEGQHRRRTTRLMRAPAARHSFRRRRAAPPRHRRALKMGEVLPLRKTRSTSTPPRGLKVERGERASALSRKGKGGVPVRHPTLYHLTWGFVFHGFSLRFPLKPLKKTSPLRLFCQNSYSNTPPVMHTGQNLAQNCHCP